MPGRMSLPTSDPVVVKVQPESGHFLNGCLQGHLLGDVEFKAFELVCQEQTFTLTLAAFAATFLRGRSELDVAKHLAIKHPC